MTVFSAFSAMIKTTLNMDKYADTDSQWAAIEGSWPGHPRIGFAVQRRLLLALLILCVLTSLGLLLVLGIVQWRDLHTQAFLAAERATVVAKEHADKVFELDTSLSGRV